MEDLEIIKSVQNGNSHAFAFLVNKYQDIVFSIALKVLKNREEAEEMAQETFIKAYRSIHSFRGNSKFSTWLYSITYNTCITQTRKKKIQTAPMEYLSDTPDESDGPFGEFPLENRITLLEEALKKLPGDDYMLLMLYYYDNQSVDDICGITGLSDSNVKIKLHRARKKMYTMMNEAIKQE